MTRSLQNRNKWQWLFFKKSNSIIGRTKKNRWENLKHNYVALQLPRNCIQTIASLFFLRNKFPFIHRVAALLFQSQTRTIKNCWTRVISLYSINIFFSQQFWRINKLISWMVLNWRNTSISKNTYSDICYI